jgi:hypothetical protein
MRLSGGSDEAHPQARSVCMQVGDMRAKSERNGALAWTRRRSGASWFLMGVYIFRSLFGPWIKVGSYVCRGRRPSDNPWYRVARRGFHSITHPSQLQGPALSAEGLELVVWYPNIGRREEGAIHRAFSDDSVGEFHKASEEGLIVEMCEALGGVAEVVTQEQKDVALLWAGADPAETPDDVRMNMETPSSAWNEIPQNMAIRQQRDAAKGKGKTTQEGKQNAYRDGKGVSKGRGKGKAKTRSSKGKPNGKELVYKPRTKQTRSSPSFEPPVPAARLP